MAKYNLIFKNSVEKDLRKLPKTSIKKAFEWFEKLQDNPLPSESTKLQGTDNLYRVRLGDYRIIYSISHGEKNVIIQYVRHRKEVYRLI